MTGHRAWPRCRDATVRTAVVLLVSLLFAGAARAQDRVIGLLSLPEVFGDDVCDKFSPSEVKLYDAPGSQSIVGAIRVDQYWSFPPEGGCRGLTVRVHRPGKPDAVALPTEEYGYETPAAIVLDECGRWFKVRLEEGAAWLLASARDTYFPLEKLLDSSLTYLTGAFDGRLASSPGAALHRVQRAGDGWRAGAPGSGSPGKDVRVVEFRRVGGRLWIHVEVLSASACVPDVKPRVVRRGWLPAQASSGEPTVWFASRGC